MAQTILGCSYFAHVLPLSVQASRPLTVTRLNRVTLQLITQFLSVFQVSCRGINQVDIKQAGNATFGHAKGATLGKRIRHGLLHVVWLVRMQR
jgi:hypothetical protein